MCCTADILMPTQNVLYSRQFNDHKICAVQQTVKCSHKMYGTADSLTLKQYV